MQKRFYDKTSKPLKPLIQGQVVRLQTDKGHTQLGHIHGPSKEPRRYLVEVDGVLYRRNRQHLLPVKERRLASQDPDAPPLGFKPMPVASIPAPAATWSAHSPH